MEARKTEIAMGDCIDIDKKEWEKNGKMIDRRNWKLLIQNMDRKK